MISKKMMDEIVARVAWVMPGARLENSGIVIPLPFGRRQVFTPLHVFDSRKNNSWGWETQFRRHSPRSKWSTGSAREISLTGSPQEIAQRIVFEYAMEGFLIEELRSCRVRWKAEKERLKEEAAA